LKFFVKRSALPSPTRNLTSMKMSHRGPFLLLFATGRQLSTLLAEEMADAPFTPDEFAVTSVLLLEQPVRPTELARLTGLRPTTLSNYLRRFEAGGTVARRKDPADGRASLVELTPEGAERTRACFPGFASAIGSFQKALAESGVPELDVVETLESVSRALDLALEKVAAERSAAGRVGPGRVRPKRVRPKRVRPGPRRA
jgi:DNA-binding MarR family transcriptional regulator